MLSQTIFRSPWHQVVDCRSWKRHGSVVSRLLSACAGFWLSVCFSFHSSPHPWPDHLSSSIAPVSCLKPSSSWFSSLKVWLLRCCGELFGCMVCLAIPSRNTRFGSHLLVYVGLPSPGGIVHHLRIRVTNCCWLPSHNLAISTVGCLYAGGVWSHNNITLQLSWTAATSTSSTCSTSHLPKMSVSITVFAIWRLPSGHRLPSDLEDACIG